MIKGIHAMFYSSDASGLRSFFKEKFELKSFDAGNGWLIFDLPQAELGCHPSEEAKSAVSGSSDISFYCDDIVATVKELRDKGVDFKGEVEDHGYGLVTYFYAPGNFMIQLFQPRYKH